MDITGKWVAFSAYAGSDPGLTITKKKFTYAVRKNKGEGYEQRKTGYKLKEIRHLISGAECFEIELDPLPGYGMPEYYCHMEKIGDKEVPIVSLTTMEYDGRGLIVMVSYIRKKDLDLVTEDYESLLYKTLNRRSAAPMHKVTGIPSMGSFTPPMGMPYGSGKKCDPWDCSCGSKGNTGKFCPECGNPMP